MEMAYRILWAIEPFLPKPLFIDAQKESACVRAIIDMLVSGVEQK